MDEKQGNVRYFGKLIKLTVEFFSCTKLCKKRNMKPCYSCYSCENENYEKHPLSVGVNRFADLSYLFIYST